MWDVDARKGRVTYSSTWKKMLGYGEDDLDGDLDLWLTLIHPDDRARVEQADRDHTAGRTAMFEAEFRMRHREGHWIWILDRGMIVERDREGRMQRAIGTLTDITPASRLKSGSYRLPPCSTTSGKGCGLRSIRSATR